MGEQNGFRKLARAASAAFPENYFLQTAHYCIASEKIPAGFDGLRIVHLSDLHGCSFGRGNSRLLRRIRLSEPDLVVMTGDMADGLTRDFGPVFRFSESLCRDRPVYFVSGNHEEQLRAARRNEFLEGLRSAGAHILDNASAPLARGGAVIRLCGLRLPARYYRADHSALTVEGVRRRIGRKEEGEYTILLTHNPFFFPVYAAWGADLTLCGHVHGGMVRLPWIGGLLSPERSFFPKYSAGDYRIGSRDMIVSRGLAAGPRIGNIPEVVEVTLRSRSGMEK